MRPNSTCAGSTLCTRESVVASLEHEAELNVRGVQADAGSADHVLLAGTSCLALLSTHTHQQPYARPGLELFLHRVRDAGGQARLEQLDRAPVQRAALGCTAAHV